MEEGLGVEVSAMVIYFKACMITSLIPLLLVLPQSYLKKLTRPTLQEF